MHLKLVWLIYRAHSKAAEEKALSVVNELQSIGIQVILFKNIELDQSAIKLLSDKVCLMDTLVDELIEKETLEAEFVINSLNSYLSTK